MRMLLRHLHLGMCVCAFWCISFFLPPRMKSTLSQNSQTIRNLHELIFCLHLLCVILLLMDIFNVSSNPSDFRETWSWAKHHNNISSLSGELINNDHSAVCVCVGGAIVCVLVNEDVFGKWGHSCCVCVDLKRHFSAIFTVLLRL